VLSTSPTELYAAVLDAPVPPRKRPGRPSVDHLARTGRIIAAATDPADMRRRLGAAALDLEAESDGSWPARWRSIVAARLADPHWPQRDLRITAVDARTGEGVVLDRHSGLDLVDAVAASTSSGMPYAVGDDRLLDGGYRRNENADLAAGYERVLVLSPLGGRTRTPLAWGQHLDAQVDELRAGGSRVETVVPDRAALDAYGDDLMDPATRAPAARAGHGQGRGLAARLSDLWR
jgi:NTE family protein